MWSPNRRKVSYECDNLGNSGREGSKTFICASQEETLFSVKMWMRTFDFKEYITPSSFLIKINKLPFVIWYVYISHKQNFHWYLLPQVAKNLLIYLIWSMNLNESTNSWLCIDPLTDLFLDQWLLLLQLTLSPYDLPKKEHPVNARRDW